MASMDTLRSHPQNALQAKAFTSPASLSFPGGASALGMSTTDNNGSGANVNGGNERSGTLQGHQESSSSAGVVVTPATPAATPGGGTGVSGIVPTLQ